MIVFNWEKTGFLIPGHTCILICLVWTSSLISLWGKNFIQYFSLSMWHIYTMWHTQHNFFLLKIPSYKKFSKLDCTTNKRPYCCLQKPSGKFFSNPHVCLKWNIALDCDTCGMSDQQLKLVFGTKILL